jgi:hypothetical protein
VLVEFLASAGTLAGLVPLHAAQPLQLLDVPADTQPDHQHRLVLPGRHLHHARHVGERVECERVEFLAGAGTLADPVPLHAAQPLQLLDVPTSTASCHSAGRVGELVEILASVGTLACLVPLHSAQPLQLLDVPTSTASCHPATASTQPATSASWSSTCRRAATAGCAGRADPVAFFLVLACRARSGDRAGHQHRLVPP